MNRGPTSLRPHFKGVGLTLSACRDKENDDACFEGNFGAGVIL
jgi:hypothetical protein